MQFTGNVYKFAKSSPWYTEKRKQ